MLLLRIRMRETMMARSNVFGYITDNTAVLPMAFGPNPNSTPRNIAPIRKAFPKERCFLIQMRMKTKTRKILIMAEMCSMNSISYQYPL